MLFPKPRNLKNKLIQEEVDILPDEAPNKPSLFGKIGKFFKSEDIPQGTDELGIEKPSIHKESGFRKLLNYAVPATLGLASGVGVLPGLASAYAGSRNREESGRETALESYEKQRKSALDAERQKSLDQLNFGRLGLEGEKFGETVRHNRAVEDDKNNKHIDKYVERLGGKVGTFQEAMGRVGAIEDKLGFDLYNYDKNKEKVGGKDIDLPGVSIPGIGRVSAYSQDAKELQSAVSGVFNTILKDRSGAVITSNELERLKEEFGRGKYNTEPEMIKALQRYKKEVARLWKDREASYSPEVVDEYGERGGQVSRNFQPTSDSNQYKKQAPSGATGIAPGSDGHKYYHDAQGNILGRAD